MHKPAICIGTMININPSFITTSPVWDAPITRGAACIRNMMNNLKKKREGLCLSRQSRRKLSNAINWLCVSAKTKKIFSKELGKNFYFKINFITLTIPLSDVKINAREATSMLLNPWLTYARKYFGLSNYIWKLELTEKKVVHFHITSDTFIHWRELRRSWNNLLRRRNLLDNYFNEHAHYDANSTDIHATYKIKNLTAYLCKYLLKDAYKSDLPAGRIWGCSQALSAANRCQVEFFQGEGREEFTSLFSKEIEWKRITVPDKFGGTPRSIGEMFFIKPVNWALHLKGMIKDAYENHKIKIREGTRQTLFTAPFINDDLCLIP